MKLTMMAASRATAREFLRCVENLGHVADLHESADAAYAAIREREPDLLVVADGDGLAGVSALRRMRLAGYTGLTLFIAARDTSADRVAAFNAGADQVVPRGVPCEEYAVRVLALLRYKRATPSDEISYQSVRVMPSRLSAYREERSLELRGKPFSLLEFFVRHPEEVHERARIASAVWDQNLDVFSNVIDVTVSKLRRQLDRGVGKRYLHTVIGKGYMLSEEGPGAAA
ncbi:MAG: response regulator transcription factor [Planctomycetota bacterium]